MLRIRSPLVQALVRCIRSPLEQVLVHCIRSPLEQALVRHIRSPLVQALVPRIRSPLQVLGHRHLGVCEDRRTIGIRHRHLLLEHHHSHKEQVLELRIHSP